MGILPNLHAGGGNIFRRRGITRAVVCTKQVVVNGFRHAHDSALITDLLHILRDFVAGVHGVISAVIEEVTYIVLLENLQDSLIVGVVLIRIGQLVAAGTQGRGGRVLHNVQLIGVLLSHVVQLIIQYALDAVGRTQHTGDAVCFKSRLNHTLGTGVDDRGGTSGLTNDTCAFQFAHGKILL